MSPIEIFTETISIGFHLLAQTIMLLLGLAILATPFILIHFAYKWYKTLPSKEFRACCRVARAVREEAKYRAGRNQHRMEQRAANKFYIMLGRMKLTEHEQMHIREDEV